MQFFELSHDERFAIYDQIDALGCATHGCGSSGQLSVAVAKGQFAALVNALHRLKMRHVDLYTFPLGTDKPPAELRHESHGQPDSCWLIATFKPETESCA
jgi:hypothetical protein